MALSDLSVFSEYLRTAMTEIVAQKIDVFNAASRGTIVLRAGSHVGDFSDTLMFAKLANLVKRRNAYGSGALTTKQLTNLTETSVKVAAGTNPVNLDPSMWSWIQQSPEVAAAALGKQMAGDMMADMLNTAINATDAALGQISALVYDATADTVKTCNPTAMNNAAFLMGDRQGDIAAWIMHSKALRDFYNGAMTGLNVLFTYGTINVLQDPFGRLFVCTDAPGLVTAGSPNTYHALGLKPGAVTVEQNNDFDDNMITTNGDENIRRTYQAEWTFQLAVDGFQWDKTNGGKSPTDAALVLATNWDRYATSNKDLPGVILKTQ